MENVQKSSSYNARKSLGGGCNEDHANTPTAFELSSRTHRCDTREPVVETTDRALAFSYPPPTFFTSAQARDLTSAVQVPVELLQTEAKAACAGAS